MISRWLLRLLSRVVPRAGRGDWLEEWKGELAALKAARARDETGNAYPGVGGFLMGAFPHALWMRTEGWTMAGIWQDLRFAGRTLRRSPAFALVAAATLALGIGANAAIFSLINGLLLRSPAGVESPERLVQIARSYDDAPRWDNWSWPAAQLIAEESPLLSQVAGYAGGSFLIGRGEEVEPVGGEFVSGGYFGTLGVSPALGRLIGPEDEEAPGAHPVVVLSHGLFQRRFGSDPGVIGTTLHVGANPYEVIGVAPEGFAGVDALGNPPQLWVPALQRRGYDGSYPFDLWGSSWFYLFGRLAEGASFEGARASMDGVTARLRESSEVNEDIRVLLAQGVGLAPEERAEGRRIAGLLAMIAALVLVLTCANVGNLFLARAAGRTGEVSVRQALGAGRGRLVRQLVTESLALSVLATLLAIPLVAWAGGLLPVVFPYTTSVSFAPDVRVYAFLAAVGVLAGLIFGLAPAWSVAQDDVAKTLREGGTTGVRRRTRLRDALVVGQLAISLGLVAGAALLGRSVINARVADPGFDPDGLVVGFANLRTTGRYDQEAGVAFQERLLAELRGLPNVTAAALASQTPVLGGHSRATVRPSDRPDEPGAEYEAEETVVTPGYFETMGIPLVRGRLFRDPASEPEPIVVVNESLARRFWPDRDPIGQAIEGGMGPVRVVGVVGDVQMRSLRSPSRPGVYYPFHQGRASVVVIHARARGTTSAAAAAVRRAVATVDPEVPITGVTELRAGLGASLSDTRTFGLLVTVFAGLALVLSLIGLYGMVSHTVASKSREMGIRMALGAGGRQLVNVVLRRWGALAVVGVVLGLVVAAALGKALESTLFGVSPNDPVVVGGAGLLLVLTSLAAAWLPARRATRVDAVVSLREGGA
ncbi:MAG: ABC transporter permease [Gemmatimonadetes bacterium]|nr:ABC transporter permease [Gemmatimonadota bacterium]